MKHITAKRNYLLLHDDGRIHYPFSKFLTDEYDNPNTRELVAQSLRICYRFCVANKIELVVRAAKGRCLTYDESKKLLSLCYRPLGEIETLSNKQIVSLTSAKAGKAPKQLRGAVEPNTANKRLLNIANWLDFFFKVFLQPNIDSQSLRDKLKIEYDTTVDQLSTSISGTKQGHHHDIRSIPSPKFLQIISAIYVWPEDIFRTNAGKPSRTWHRDRAMALLACEGLRPGTLGNIARSDFNEQNYHLIIKDNREKLDETTSSTPLLKAGSSTKVNSASEGMIKLWPFTVDAISEYIKEEREPVLSKGLKNRSRGFLLLNERGKPIKHRSTITSMFNRLGKRLSDLGLLDVGNDPYFPNSKEYDFCAYVLRHSSASYFVEEKGTDEKTLDSMKSRYLWTKGSKQPQRYAARALSDKANIDLMEFYEMLTTAVAAKKRSFEQSQTDDIAVDNVKSPFLWHPDYNKD
ncbi:site-specific integrase [Oryzomonas rubra]|uniref:Site-specific integrase n=1 Tax=Oryzomonas rubra TaxID=2509454 RepID=A0A5A9XM97_9BACT|nr:site-specific integrase [Oryzomonas rubra]KAA0894247.1 site-specific integrase [Oryzomonas rubra]